MALFARNPEEKQGREIADKLAEENRRREKNAAQLRDAEADLAARITVVDQLALDGDEGKLDAALEKQGTAEKKATALKAASIKIAATIADLEAQAAAVADRRQRQATAVEIEKITRDLERAGTAYKEAAAELATIARRAGDVVIDAQALMHYAQGAASEVLPAILMCVELLRGRATATIAGSAPASLPRPVAPPPKLAIVPAEPAVNVFALKNLKYVNREGGVTTICKNKRHDLPKALAELALSSNMALPLSEKKRIEDLEYNAESFFVPAESSCVWLGTPGKEAPARSMRPGGPPVMHSLSPTEFTPNPYTPPPYTLRVPTSPIEPMAVGARKADAEE
jgi:hypothetical protein